MAPYLDAVSLKRPLPDGFPFDLPLLQGLEELRFERPVTFFVGENGSGKSTLLEGLAVALEATAIGAHDLKRDPSLAPARRLAARMRLVRRRHAQRRAFFRAEDAFGFTQRIIREMAEHEELAEEVGAQFAEGSWGQKLARGTVKAQAGALAARYGQDPDALSHGQSFLDLLVKRLLPNGLYLLDEPETPLSARRQLSLLALLRRAVEEGCQVILATHSPIVMALPEAQILLFEEGMIRPIAYDEVDQVSLTRDFLKAPERYLRDL